jgi:RNA polymerase sigma-70 factor, ECF subfamily
LTAALLTPKMRVSQTPREWMQRGVASSLCGRPRRSRSVCSTINLRSTGDLVSAERLPALPETVGFRVRNAVDASPHVQARVSDAVARAKEGDREALRFLYVLYANNIYGYILSIVRDDHEAEDLTQHVFAKLMTAIARYDDVGVPFFAWLLRLARNLTIDHVRSNRPIPSEHLFHVKPATQSDIDRPQTVREAIDTLPEDQRQVVLLRHVVGLTPGEIANCLGRSEGSIHGLHHRGRRALQQELVRLESTPFTRGPHHRELEHAA